jgi:hypothetical protein
LNGWIIRGTHIIVAVTLPPGATVYIGPAKKFQNVRKRNENSLKRGKKVVETKLIQGNMRQRVR